MSEPEPTSTQADFEALKALQADAPELERIEALLDRFNVFEAIGFVEREVNHSHFLAFLLDPSKSHGLGDLFLRRLLREAVDDNEASLLLVSEDNLDAVNLSQTLVRREHHHIDILLTNNTHKLVVIVENKIRTTEHSDQLSRYYLDVENDHPGWKVFGIYLTPYGEVPSHEAYLPLSYGAICRVLDGVLEDRGSTLNPDVRVAVEHYAEMVRRNIVKDADLSRLSREIYQKHYRAIHRIIEDLTTTSEAILKLMRSLIKEAPKLTYGYRETEGMEDWIVFDHRDWGVPALKVGERYRDSNRLLYFVIHSDLSGSLDVWLELGPGDSNTRNRLLGAAHDNPSMFVEATDTSGKYVSLFKRPLLTGNLLDRLTGEEREQEIRRQWDEFIERDLPKIEAALKKEQWIWEPVQQSEGTSSGVSNLTGEENETVLDEPFNHEE